MSFVGRRGSRRPVDDEDDATKAAQKSSSGFKSRLSSLSPFSSSSKRTPNLSGPPPPLPTLPSLPTSPPLSEGINGYISKASSSYASSQRSRSVRSASPPPNGDLQPPVPVPRRASALTYRGTSPPPNRDMRNIHREAQIRPHAPIDVVLSASTPELRNEGSPRWDQLSRSDATSELSLPPSLDLSLIPSELLGDVFAHSSRHELTRLARVCKAFVSPARDALYGELDLRNVREGYRVEKCVTLLASRRDIAGFVRLFACRTVPGMKGNDPSNHLSTVTFAIALSNMSQLETLILPRFSAHLLFHTSFRLEQFTMLSEDLTDDECRDMLNWLMNQPSITSLSLPNLAMKSFVFYSGTSGANTPDTSHMSSDGSSIYSHSTSIHSQFSQQDLSNPSTFLLSPNLLPQLTHFYGPVSLANALVPGRPVKSVALHVYHSLHDLLRPSTVIRSLNRSELQITRLSLVASPKHRVDVRTFERMLISMGRELGAFLEAIEVEWVLEDEFLYKNIITVLPRFRVLRTLRLHRRSPPPPPSSPPPSFPLPSSSPPSSPSTLIAKSRVFTITPPESPKASIRNRPVGRRLSLDMPLSRVHERAHLVAWTKQCPSLRIVVFLSGAEWKIARPPGENGAALFTYLGADETILPIRSQYSRSIQQRTGASRLSK